jgi:hypothetical protein
MRDSGSRDWHRGQALEPGLGINAKIMHAVISPMQAEVAQGALSLQPAGYVCGPESRHAFCAFKRRQQLVQGNIYDNASK